jgi:tetratricopeptide (TPR) repeat protein
MLIENVKKKDPPESIWEVLYVLRLALLAGDAGLARHFLEGTSPPVAASERFSLLTARAILAEVEGRVQEAAELYLEAAKRWEEFGIPPCHGEALLGAGRCLVGLQRLDDARARLDEAHNVFELLGARVFVDEIDELLSQVTALRS